MEMVAIPICVRVLVHLALNGVVIPQDVIPSFAIGLVIWWNFVHYIFFEPSRNERGEIDECIGCNVKDCYDIYGDSTNEKCKWKDLIDKEAEEMKDDN